MVSLPLDPNSLSAPARPNAVSLPAYISKDPAERPRVAVGSAGSFERLGVRNARRGQYQRRHHERDNRRPHTLCMLAHFAPIGRFCDWNRLPPRGGPDLYRNDNFWSMADRPIRRRPAWRQGGGSVS